MGIVWEMENCNINAEIKTLSLSKSFENFPIFYSVFSLNSEG